MIPRTDTHIHATRYRADGPRADVTVAAVLARCAEVGIERAGVIEHLGGRRHPMACLLELAAEFRRIPHPIEARLGTEVGIAGADGAVDVDEGVREQAGLDFVLAGEHGVPPGVTELDEYLDWSHRALMAVAQGCAWVDVLAHPWRVARGLAIRTRETGWSFSLVPERRVVELADALAQAGKALEVHSSAAGDFGDPAYGRMIDTMLARGVRLALASDAHQLAHIGGAEPAHAFLIARGVPPELIWFPE